MGFSAGSVTVNNTAGGTAIMAPKAAGLVVVQNNGTATVTIGGPGVVYGQGLVLASGALPVGLQATHFGNIEDVDDQLYGITLAGTCTVTWVHGY